MTLREFRKSLKKVILGLNRSVGRVVEDHGAPVTDEQRQALAAELLPKIARARRQAHELGADRMRAQARDLGVAPPTLARIRPYSQAAVVTMLENATRVNDPAGVVELDRDPSEPPRRRAQVVVEDTGGDSGSRVRVTDSAVGRPKVSVQVLDSKTRREHRRATVEVTDDNRLDPDVVAVVSKKIQASAARHARMPSREAFTDSIDAAAQLDEEESAGEVIGWARVLTGAESCGYCAMLASRGPVYKSKDEALYVTPRSKRYKVGEMDKYHDDCDCEVVMVREGADWRGRTQFEELEQLWKDSTAPPEEKRTDRPLLRRRKSLRQFTGALNREIADGNAERFIVRPIDVTDAPEARTITASRERARGSVVDQSKPEAVQSWRVDAEQVATTYPDVIGGGQVPFTPDQRPDVGARRVHILDGDETGGGHREGTGAGKSEFIGWDDEQVLHAVDLTLADPHSIERRGSTLYFRRFIDGVPVEALVAARKSTPTLRTAYPQWDALNTIRKGKGQVLWGA